MGRMTDNERLMDLQKRFLSGDCGAWAGLWVNSFELAQKMIISEMKKKNLHFDEDMLYDLSINAVEYVLRRFRKKTGYKVNKNFASAIYFGCKHSIYYRTKADELMSEICKIYIPQNRRVQLGLTI